MGLAYLSTVLKVSDVSHVAVEIESLPARNLNETNSGVIVFSVDSEALAKTVIMLKENRALAQSLGESGLNHVEQYKSIEAIGSKMKRVFETLQLRAFIR